MLRQTPSLEYNEIVFRFPGSDKIYLYLRSGQIDSGAHIAFSSLGTGKAFFLNWWVEPQANHSPTSSIGVKTEGRF